MALDPLRIPAASLARPTTMFATPAMITVRRVALCPLRLFTEDTLPESAASNHACRDTRREISSARSPSGIHIGHTSAPRRPARHAHEAAGTGIADATADQVRRYVLDGGDDDLWRLLSLSESFAEHARRAPSRTASRARAPGRVAAQTSTSGYRNLTSAITAYASVPDP